MKLKLFFISLFVPTLFVNAQNVGIGTGRPLQKLHVEGATFLNGNVGIGYSNSNVPLSFAPLLGKKITLYPGATGDVGFAVQGNLLQIYSDNPNADIAFGYDQAGVLTERMRIKADGSVSIGVVNPNASALLDISSNNKGFLPPRMTLLQRNAIDAPANGLILHCTDCTPAGPYSYNGSSWVSLTTSTPTYTVGQAAQGGIVFWVDETGQHGLVAAITDQTTNDGIRWNNGVNVPTKAMRIHYYGGAENTERITESQGAGTYAATLCAEYGGGGYGDWYLPSVQELYLMYTLRNTIGNFNVSGAAPTNSIYWSSTEFQSFGDYTFAWHVVFTNGLQYTTNRSFVARVRAVRRF